MFQGKACEASFKTLLENAYYQTYVIPKNSDALNYIDG